MDVIATSRQLLESGAVQAVIGFEAGTRGIPRPAFIRRAEGAGALVFDANCTQNLGTYLTRPEVRTLGRVAVTATPDTLRAILQLMAERQLKEEDVLALAVDATGEALELPTAQAVEEHLAMVAQVLPDRGG